MSKAGGDSELSEYHNAASEKAAEIYLNGLNPTVFSEAWYSALRRSRVEIAEALRDSKMLSDVAGALTKNGAHMKVLRFLFAPPISQDQFKILCPSWNKQSEIGAKPLAPATAAKAQAIFHQWRQKELSPWVDIGTSPTNRQIRRIYGAIAPLMASQVFGTSLRTERSKTQETEVLELLNSMGWKKLPSKTLDKRASLGNKEFMHKTRFATSSGVAQEVDVACGLKDSYVLAMECKVTNDKTNSVKRVNDVLKKANSWKEHWGSFVETAALLQGVIAPKDVNRLLHSGVHVFWSHDLVRFREWIESRTT